MGVLAEYGLLCVSRNELVFLEFWLLLLCGFYVENESLMIKVGIVSVMG